MIRKIKGDLVFEYPWIVYPLLVLAIVVACVFVASFIKKDAREKESLCN